MVIINRWITNLKKSNCEFAALQKLPLAHEHTQHFKCCWSEGLIVVSFSFFFCMLSIDKEDFMRHFQKRFYFSINTCNAFTLKEEYAKRGSILFTLLRLNGQIFFLIICLQARTHLRVIERDREWERRGRVNDFQCFLVWHWGMDKYSPCNNKWKRQRLSRSIPPLLSSLLLSAQSGSRSTVVGRSDVVVCGTRAFFPFCLENYCQIQPRRSKKRMHSINAIIGLDLSIFLLYF